MQHIGCNHLTYGDADACGSRAVTMRFLRGELFADMEQLAFAEGEVLGEDKQHAHHTLVEIGEPLGADCVTRVLDVVHAGATEMLYPYSKQPVADGTELDDKLQNPDEYVIALNLPASFSQTTANYLHKLIHQYMVYRGLHDWISIANEPAAQKWAAKIAETEKEINSVKHARTGVLRRHSYPF